MRPLIITAPAKVNLFLGVGAVRPDGYHEVATVLHSLELADIVTLTPSDDLTVACDADLGIPAQDNLAYRAAMGFSAAFDVDVLLDVHIAKHIPSGAGLGGGSADAAAVLAGLCHWAGGLPRDDPRILATAAAIGADVPFLLLGEAALMNGRGDHLVRHLAPIAADIVLVKPTASVPTAAAYRAFDADPRPAGSAFAVEEALERQSLQALADALGNNMTDASAGLVPEIAEALAWLRAQAGVLGAAMAGSGSAIFALCGDPAGAKATATAAREHGWWSAATRTSAGGPSVAEGVSAR